MIYQHELDSLNEDESSLLYYIVSKENTEPERLDFIRSTRKDYLLGYYHLNRDKFNEKGTEIFKSLIEKLCTKQKEAT